MRKLGDLNVVGTCTPVLWATKEEAGPENIEDGGFAAYDYERPRIIVRKWPAARSASGTWADTAHEAVHCINWETGVWTILKDACPHLSEKEIERIEERITRAFAPGLVTALDDLIALRAEIRKVCK